MTRTVDEWADEVGTPAPPMIQTTDILTAAVPVIQAEVRERIAAAITAHRLAGHNEHCLCGRCCALTAAAWIAATP